MTTVIRKSQETLTRRREQRDTAGRWYKDAIIYQLHVRAFRDANGDGVGDLRGLTQQLDYIQDLGVTAIWLLPLFPSPLKDDGYDIADYTQIHPQYGTLDDFRRLLDQAHQRNLRVITELVLNHTSDQHAWFQRSRRSSPGSRWRDWYVWSDTPEKYKDARIIFQDFETSNWSWDPIASAYFWHRFYSHQPDLNFDNPEVREAMLEVLDFWLETGVDALRLDAVPYLFEREGTNCENLPETHAFLRQLRARIDSKYCDRMLLAEANQWPEDAAEYFGNGDECHMNFHFPLMPRLFVAVEREDRFPLVDILEQTPSIPADCQWAIFLRNHDELTLEMVTDEERDYMYRTYALDAKMRINLGIRRRLAPLLSNDRRKIELMNALLLSLPGTPVIYYGDEIGMGDNYYLGDRNGVRTPMQWSADRNAGFSSAHPQSLYLPVIIDPEYHYEFRNVEMEQANSQSLLWWTRRILDLRKQHPAFGEGKFEAVGANNSKILAFCRETEREALLIVANLSRFSQAVELTLTRWQGRTPIELFGQSAFPTIGKEPYRLTLGPYGFFWFCIGCGEENEQELAYRIPTCLSGSSLEDFCGGHARRVLQASLQMTLVRNGRYVCTAKRLESVRIVDVFPLEAPTTAEELGCLLVSGEYADGDSELFVIPVCLIGAEAAKDFVKQHPLAAIMYVDTEGERRLLCEANWNIHFWRQLLCVVADARKVDGVYGALIGTSSRVFEECWNNSILDSTPSVQAGEHSNKSAIFDDRLILKLFRHATPDNPDLEMGIRLTESGGSAHVPRVAGTIECEDAKGRKVPFAVLQEYVSNVGDAWTYTLDELRRFFERVQSRTLQELNQFSEAVREGEARPMMRYPQTLAELMNAESSSLATNTIGGYLHLAELLGRRLGELHLALASIQGDPAFAREPFSQLYQRSLYQSLRSQTRSTLNLLRLRYEVLCDQERALGERVVESEEQLLRSIAGLLIDRLDAVRIRCHGECHLGHALFTGKDFVFIDFEGDTDRPVSERRIKSSPLRDVASMLRSYSLITEAALRGHAVTNATGHGAASLADWASFWCGWTSASFFRAYLVAAHPGAFLPRDDHQLRILLGIFSLEQALSEVRTCITDNSGEIAPSLKAVVQIAKHLRAEIV